MIIVKRFSFNSNYLFISLFFDSFSRSKSDDLPEVIPLGPTNENKQQNKPSFQTSQLKQQQQHSSQTTQPIQTPPSLSHRLTPEDIVTELNKNVIGQQEAKRAVALAMRSRFRRALLAEDYQKEVHRTLSHL